MCYLFLKILLSWLDCYQLTAPLTGKLGQTIRAGIPYTHSLCDLQIGYEIRLGIGNYRRRIGRGRSTCTKTVYSRCLEKLMFQIIFYAVDNHLSLNKDYVVIVLMDFFTRMTRIISKRLFVHPKF